MADLLVRGVDEEIVRALEEQARAHGRTAEAEHREILSAALARTHGAPAQPRRRSLAELLEATHNDPRSLTVEEQWRLVGGPEAMMMENSDESSDPAAHSPESRSPKSR